MPSLLRAAEKVEGIKETEISGEELGLPAVLLHTGEGNYVISCIPAGDEKDVWLYRVKRPGEEAFEFPALDSPENLETFPYLLRIYDLLNGDRGERIVLEDDGDEESRLLNKAPEIFSRTFNETRLPALSEALSLLGFESVISTGEDGTSHLVMLEELEPVLFTYIVALPDQGISLLEVQYGGKEIFIPEEGGVKEPEVYQKLLENLYHFG